MLCSFSQINESPIQLLNSIHNQQGISRNTVIHCELPAQVHEPNTFPKYFSTT